MKDPAEKPHSPFSPFMQRLSSRPILVTIVSFGLTLVLTVVVLILEPDAVDILGVVSLAATLWGLTLALVIYLLTAQDTDRVLEHISDLQEQLAASLAEPETEPETEGEGEEGAAPDPVPEQTVTTKHEADPAPHTQMEPRDSRQPRSKTEQQAAELHRQRGGAPHGHQDRGFFYTSGSGVKLEEVAPPEYVSAWEQTTGRAASEVFRAWTRNQGGASPWVFMTQDGNRWSVFASDDDAPSVIDLTDPQWGRVGRAGLRGNRGRRGGQDRGNS